MSDVIALNVGNWNSSVISLAFIGLVLWVPYQITVDWWGNRRDRERRERAHEAAAQPPDEDS